MSLEGHQRAVHALDIRPTLLAVAVIALICTACTGDVVRGDSLTVDHTFELVFETGVDRYVVPSEAAAGRARSGAYWDLPECISLDTPEIQITEAEIGWSDGTSSYTARGWRLRVRASGQVDADCKPGAKLVVLVMPGLKSVVYGMGLWSLRDSGRGHVDPERLAVTTITVHASRTGAVMSTALKIGFAIVVIIILLVLFAWLHE